MSFSKKLARFALSGALAMSMVLPNSLAVFQAKVNADSLYLRQSPGGAVITTLSKGTTVAVLNNSSSWYKVSVNGKEGYVSGEYLTGTTTTDFALGTGTVKCSSSVNFRSAPSTSSTSYGELKNGTAVNVVGISGGWYKVTYGGKTGYIHPDYLALSSSSASTGTAVTPNTSSASYTGTAATVKCNSSVNFRSASNTSSTVLGELKNGTAVTVVGTEGDWSKVTYAGKTGYIRSDYLAMTGGTELNPSNNAASYNVSTQRASVLNYAAQFLGVPYVYGGSTPSGFDCSGFTSYVFKNTVGSIPRVAQAQYDATTRVSLENLLPGDLVFFGSSAYSISHVGIYVGSNQFIHAPHTGEVVKYESLTGTYATRFQGGGRVIFD